MVLLGLDPGLSGGIAFINDGEQLLHYQRMPVKPVLLPNGSKDGSKRIIDIAQVAALVARWEPEHAFVEKVHAMPKQGVVSTFTFGMGYGMILGLFLSLEAVFKTELVPPRAWQKLLYANLVGVDELEPKARAMAKAYELWPVLQVQGVTHDGILDAILIAEAGRRMLRLN